MKKKYLNFLIIIGLGATLFGLSFAIGGQAVMYLRVGGILLFLLGVALLLVPQKKKEEPVNADYLYTVKESFMSAPERELYARLMRCLGGDFAIFPQVALASLVDKVNFGSYRNELFRIVDFALCDRFSLRPVLIIELNDASHKREERRRRDEKVRCIAERAGLGMLTLELDDLPDDRTLRKKIFSSIKR